MSKWRAHERELIGTFIERYNDCQRYRYEITDWPEDKKEGEVEALAEATGMKTLAIEHTIIETFKGRKLDDDRFLKLLEPLEAEFAGAFDCDLDISIEVFAINKGLDWTDIRNLIQQWLRANVSGLPGGRTVVQIPGVPFAVTLEKDPEPVRPGGRVLVARNSRPPDDLVKLIVRGIERKKGKLNRHHHEGHEAVLILESDDMTVSQAKFYQAFLKAHPLIQHSIDQIWYVHSGAFKGEETSYWFWCFAGPEIIMEAVNPPNHMIGPKYAEYWSKA